MTPRQSESLCVLYPWTVKNGVTGELIGTYETRQKAEEVIARYQGVATLPHRIYAVIRER